MHASTIKITKAEILYETERSDNTSVTRALTRPIN